MPRYSVVWKPFDKTEVSVDFSAFSTSNLRAFFDMGHGCIAIILVVFAVIVSNEEVHAKIKKIELIIDRSSNRKIGYVVTKVHPIDRKDDIKEKSPLKNLNTIDRNTLNEDEFEHAGEMQLVQDPDARAVETIGTSHFDELSSPILSEDQALESHSDHSFKTVTVVKNVPEPYPVEKTVHFPIYKNVPYPVEVPVPEPYPVEKEVPFPVKVIVKVPVKIPKPIAVIKESYYPVHVPVERRIPHKVYVPDPYPVEKKVYYEVKVPVPEPFPIERKIPITVNVPVHVPKPYPVEKVVPFAVNVEEDRPVPVPIFKPYPVPVTKHVPFPVEKVIPYPVKVKVDNPIPIPYDKPVPVKVEVQEEIPYPVEKEVHYAVEKEVPYPVVVHEEKKDVGLIKLDTHKSNDLPREDPKVYEEVIE